MKKLSEIRNEVNPRTGNKAKSTPTRPPSNIVKPKTDRAKFTHNPGEPRKYPQRPIIRRSVTSAPSGRWDEETIHEDGAAGAVGGGAVMSTSSGVSPIGGPQADSTAAAVMSRKNLYKNLFRRKVPK